MYSIEKLKRTLTVAQQDIVFHQLRQPELPMYNIGGYIDIKNSVNVSSFENVVNKQIEELEELNVKLLFKDDIGSLVYAPASTGMLKYDVSLDVEPERKSIEIIQSSLERPFELGDGNLVRPGLIKVSSNHYWFFIVAHHLVIDGWGYTNLVKKIIASYTSGRISSNKRSGSVVRKAKKLSPASAEKYWRGVLGDLPDQLFSIEDREVGSREGGTSNNRIEKTIGPELWEGFKRSCASKAQSEFSGLLACFYMTITSLYQNDDLVVGIPVHNRRTSEERDAVSLAMQVYPLVIKLSECGESFFDICKYLTRGVRQVFRHPGASISRLFSSVSQERSVDRSLLFDMLFNYQKLDFDFSDSGMDVKTHFMPNGYEQVPLTFTFCEYGKSNEVKLQVDYKKDSFNDDEVGQMIDVFVNCISQSTAKFQECWKKYNLINEKDFKLLPGCNEGHIYPSKINSVYEKIQVQSIKTPDAIALIENEKKYTFTELHLYASHLTNILRGKGVKKGNRVGVAIKSGSTLIGTFLAVIKLGAVFVPIDPKYPKTRIDTILQNADPKVVVTEPSLSSVLGGFWSLLYVNSTELDISNIKDKKHDSKGEENIQVNHADPAYIIYTSGSTGVPKGVVVNHGNVLSYIESIKACYDIDEQPHRVMQFASIAFDIFIEEICLSLFHGGSLVIREQENIPGSDEFWSIIEKQNISAVSLPTAYWHQLCNQLSSKHKKIAERNLRLCITGGESMRQDAATQWISSFSDNVRLFNTYGPTEATVIATADRVINPEEGIAIGCPIKNTSCHVVDKFGRYLPTGFVGELWISGQGVADGYWRQPEISKEKFLDHSFNNKDNKKIYRTGDSVSWLPDGRLAFHGRIDNQVKIRGMRVEPDEIAMIIRSLPNVKDVYITTLQNVAPLQLLACIVPMNTDENFELSNIVNDLVERLPEHMIPKKYSIMESLPLTVNGKVNANQLAEIRSLSLHSENYEAPLGKREEILSKNWKSLLRVDNVGRNDNFFSLGGHSLQAVELVSYLRKHDYSLPVEAIFRSPVLKDMADSLVAINDSERENDLFSNNSQSGEFSESDIATIAHSIGCTRDEINNIYFLSAQQKGFLFEHLLNEGEDNYLLSTIIKVNSQENVEKILKALATVVTRHDILRTAFVWERLEEPVQVVLKSVQLPVFSYNVEDPLDYLRFLAKPENLNIKLNNTPLFQVHTAKREGLEDVYILFATHHIIGDHISQMLLIDEIQSLTVNPDRALATPVQYKQFIESIDASDTQDSTNRFFSKLLKNFSEPSAPYKIYNVRDVRERAKLVKQSLAVELSERIKHISRQVKSSPAIIFHLAWSLVVAKTSGANDVVFGSVFSGRLRNVSGIGNILGPLVNTLPVRLQLEEKTVKEALQTLHQLMLDLVEYEQAPHSEIQKCSNVKSTTPLYTSILNYVHHKDTDEHTPWVTIDSVESREWTAYPVDLTVEDTDEGFNLLVNCDLVLDPEQLKHHTIEALGNIVEVLEKDGSQKILDLSINSENDSQTLLKWGQGVSWPVQEECLHTSFERQVARTPEKIAVQDGELHLTYSELNALANKVAHELIQSGIKTGDRVALLLNKSYHISVGIFAVLKAGAAYVPIEPDLPFERKRYFLEDSQPLCILYDHNNLDNEENLLSDIAIDSLMLEEILSNDHLPQSNPMLFDIDSSALAYIVYTSGSTGSPKGVMVDHRAMQLRVACWDERFELKKSPPRVLQMAGLGVDICFGDMLKAMLHGGCLVVCDHSTLMSSASLYQFIENNQITLGDFVPAIIRELIYELDRNGQKLKHIRHILVGSESWQGNDLGSLQKVIGEQARCYNVYGQTETVIDVCCLDVTESNVDAQTIVPMGDTLANTRFLILGERRELQPVGVMGEIYIGGEGLAAGYWGKEELSNEKFINLSIDNIFSNERFYRTGDFAIWKKDGSIEFCGRGDGQIKIRGFRVELPEVERVFATHHDVKQSVVKVVKFENNQNLLVGYYTADKKLDVSDMRQFLSNSLPEYMIPGKYIYLEQFPTTPSGKVDRNALPIMAIEELNSESYVSPVNETEKKLALIWEDILSVAQVGRNDNFFLVGGQSLLAMKLCTQIKEVFGLSIDVRTIYHHNTLSELANELDSKLKASRLMAVADETEEGFWL